MAKFLTTSGIAHQIENIIVSSKNWLILISPYLNLSLNFIERLFDADKGDVKILIIYGKDELRPNERKKLREFTNLSLLFYLNLHAKCYINEDNLVITSMNMHEYSEKKNREMGVLFQRENTNDHEVFFDVYKEVLSIMNASVKKQRTGDLNYPVPSTEKARNSINITESIAGSINNLLKEAFQASNIDKTTSKTEKQTQEKLDSIKSLTRGHCIRCGDKIKYNRKEPYCHDCYSVWKKYKNPYFEEKYCHSCGEYFPFTTLDKPLCDNCYEDSRY